MYRKTGSAKPGSISIQINHASENAQASITRYNEEKRKKPQPEG
jgi:hypothetical protein